MKQEEDPGPGEKRLGTPFLGVSRREWFAGMAMQGICSNPTTETTASELAKYSYAMADAMIAEGGGEGMLATLDDYWKFFIKKKIQESKMTTPRKLNEDDFGKKFRQDGWEENGEYFIPLAMMSNGSFVGEKVVKSIIPVILGKYYSWDYDGWVPYEGEWTPYRRIEKNSENKKNVVSMAPAFLIDPETKRTRLTEEIYPTLSQCKDAQQKYYSDKIIVWPAKDREGNEIWYQVPVGEE